MKERTSDKQGDESREYRVQVREKSAVTEQTRRYKELLKTLLAGQSDVTPDTRQQLQDELLANFEAAVQENLLVNGQPWDEAPDNDEDEASALESLLDDTIVETSRGRRRYPKEILQHVVRSLKSERKLMGLYEQAVKPQQMVRDPSHECIMSSLSSAAPERVKQAIQVIKSISALQQQAEGLCQVLSMTPSLASQQIHQDIFGSGGRSESPLPLPLPLPPSREASRGSQPIKRAVDEAADGGGYAPPNKKHSKPVEQSTAPENGMADCGFPDESYAGLIGDQNSHIYQLYQRPEEDDRQLKKREKNRVAAQRNRKKQTQRADLLHEAFVYLEQRNSELRREVDSLTEEQRLLTQLLRDHKPFCPTMHTSYGSPDPAHCSSPWDGAPETDRGAT